MAKGSKVGCESHTFLCIRVYYRTVKHLPRNRCNRGEETRGGWLIPIMLVSGVVLLAGFFWQIPILSSLLALACAAGALALVFKRDWQGPVFSPLKVQGSAKWNLARARLKTTPSDRQGRNEQDRHSWEDRSAQLPMTPHHHPSPRRRATGGSRPNAPRRTAGQAGPWRPEAVLEVVAGGVAVSPFLCRNRPPAVIQ